MTKVSNDRLGDLIAEGQIDAKQHLGEMKQRQDDALALIERAERAIKTSGAFTHVITTRIENLELVIESIATSNHRLVITADHHSLTLSKDVDKNYENRTVLAAVVPMKDNEKTLEPFFRKVGEYITYLERGNYLPDQK